jgi:BirA family biotin operon repressor/biotin-[acetyl-CoA-carboxylase] ligase
MSALTSAFDSTLNWIRQRDLNVEASFETGSTNENAKKNAMNEDVAFKLYLASHQTAGRGRGANLWFDTGAGESLLSTWSFELPGAPQAITGPRVGLAVFRAARAAWPSLPWSLKAPNDLFLNGVKVAGLLVETVSSGGKFRMLVGLGLNVLNHPRKFEATHLSAALSSGPEEDEWFKFLDQLKSQLETAAAESQSSVLTATAAQELMQALNANPAKPLTVQSVSPQGDLLHSKGQVRWTEL